MDFNQAYMQHRPNLEETQDAFASGLASHLSQERKDGWDVVPHPPQESEESDSEDSNESFVMLTEEDDGSLRVDRAL